MQTDNNTHTTRQMSVDTKHWPEPPNQRRTSASRHRSNRCNKHTLVRQRRASASTNARHIAACVTRRSAHNGSRCRHGTARAANALAYSTAKRSDKARNWHKRYQGLPVVQSASD